MDDIEQNVRNLVAAVILQAMDDFLNMPPNSQEHKEALEFLSDDETWKALNMRCRGHSVVRRLIITNRKAMRRTLDRGWRSHYELLDQFVRSSEKSAVKNA